MLSFACYYKLIFFFYGTLLCHLPYRLGIYLIIILYTSSNVCQYIFLKIFLIQPMFHTQTTITSIYNMFNFTCYTIFNAHIDKIGDSYGNRTHVTGVRGRCLNLLTNEPATYFDCTTNLQINQ